MTITINPDLQSLIPPLTAEEYAQLEANLLADGCHDPLIVWQEEQTLLDGYNRLQICERHGLDYRLQELSLPDLDAAKAWMIANQLGRRNLTPDQMSYFRGTQYAMQKRQGKRTDLTSAHNEQKSHSTAAQLARQHQVSDATIRRDAVYAKAVDAIAEAVGPEARQTLLARETKVTQHEVTQLADIAQVSPETAKDVVEAVQTARTPKAVKQMVQAAVQEVKAQIAQVGDGNLAEAGVSREALARFSSTQGAPEVLALEAEATAVDGPPVELHRNRWGSVTETSTVAPSPGHRREYTGDAEWYTPPEVVALVRQVLGTIDVDPASCAAAQQVVNATRYYTLEEDGLRQRWPGTVFCNPPYHMPEIARFCGKLLEELDAQQTTEAILLTNSVTDTDWFHRVAPRADALCFTDGRMQFVHATRDGLRPCQGQAVFYFGPQAAHFCEVFAAIGLLMQVVGAKAAGPQLALAEAPAVPPTLPQDAASLRAGRRGP